MSKVVRLSDAQLRKLEEYKKLRELALSLYQFNQAMPERFYQDALSKVNELAGVALLNDCIEYALNSLKYDIESLSAPDPEEKDIVQRVRELQASIPN